MAQFSTILAINEGGILKLTLSNIYSDTELMYLYHSYGAPPPTSTGKALVRLQGVVDRSLVEPAIADLKHQEVSYAEENRDHFWPGSKIVKLIRFNDQNEPVDPALGCYSKALSDVAAAALKRFGWELKLTGPQSIALSFIRYKIPKDGLKAFGWHTDRASWTMLTMLTDSEDPQLGWTGGDLSCSTFFFRKEPHGFHQPTTSVRRYSYKQYDGILFHNYGTLHQVEAMYPRIDCADRTILQLSLPDPNNQLFDRYARYIKTDQAELMDVELINEKMRI